MVVDVELVIPHRTPEFTKSALRYAEALGVEDIQVRLIDIHVVPYRASLDRPTIQRKQLERRLRRLTRETSLRASAEVVYARNWEQGLRRVLTSVSTVLLPIRRSSWRTSEKRLAARLRKIGHTVIWIDV
jgi:hypothetical protein